MNVSELFRLTHWVTNEIETTRIPQKYQTLQAILQEHTQPSSMKQPFDAQKNDLTESLIKVPLNMLTKHQLLFLHELGISQAVGEEGVGIIEDILYKNVIDVATSAQKLQQIMEELNKGIDKSNQIKTGLDGSVFEEEYEIENEVLIRISFTGKATMSNVVDFKKWGDTWYEIGRGIAIVHNAPPEDVKIIGATKGSIIIELAVAATIATSTSVIILSALKVVEKVLDIYTKAEEWRNLKLTGTKLEKEMEKIAENEKTAGINEISAELVKKLKIKTDTEGDKITALEKAVKNLVNFVESGGEVDFVMPKEAEPDDTSSPNYAELRNTYQEIRLLESKIKLLESKKT